MEALANSSGPAAAELCSILGGDWFEALLFAHDQAATLLDPDSMCRPPSHPEPVLHKVRICSIIFSSTMFGVN